MTGSIEETTLYALLLTLAILGLAAWLHERREKRRRGLRRRVPVRVWREL